MLLPGILSGWKPNNKGEVLSFTTHDLIIPFDHTLSPFCFSHQESVKQVRIFEAITAIADDIVTQEVCEKDRFMFANEKTDTILCFTESSK